MASSDLALRSPPGSDPSGRTRRISGRSEVEGNVLGHRSLYERRISRLSYTSSSGRSTLQGTGSEHDGFYTPNYTTTAEHLRNAASISPPLLFSSGGKVPDPAPVSSPPPQTFRHTLGNLNMFPVDVDDEEVEDDLRTPPPPVHGRSSFSSRSSTTAPSDPNTPADPSFLGRQRYRNASQKSPRRSVEGESLIDRGLYVVSDDGPRRTSVISDTFGTTADIPSVPAYLANPMSMQQGRPAASSSKDPSATLPMERNDTDRSTRGTFGTFGRNPLLADLVSVPERRASLRASQVYPNFSDHALDGVSPRLHGEGVSTVAEPVSPERPSFSSQRNRRPGAAVASAWTETTSEAQQLALGLMNQWRNTDALVPSAVVTADQIVEHDDNGRVGQSAMDAVAGPVPAEMESVDVIREAQLAQARTRLRRSGTLPSSSPDNPLGRAASALRRMGSLKSARSASQTRTEGKLRDLHISSPMPLLTSSNVEGPLHPRDYGHLPVVDPIASTMAWPTQATATKEVEEQQAERQPRPITATKSHPPRRSNSIKGRLRTLSGTLRRKDPTPKQTPSASLRSSPILGKEGQDTPPSPASTPSLAGKAPLTIASLASGSKLPIQRQPASPGIKSEVMQAEQNMTSAMTPSTTVRPATASAALLPTSQSASARLERNGVDAANGQARPWTADRLPSSTSVASVHAIRRKPVPTFPQQESDMGVVPEPVQQGPLSMGKVPRQRSALSLADLNGQANGVGHAKERELEEVLGAPLRLVDPPNAPQRPTQLGPAVPRRKASFSERVRSNAAAIGLQRDNSTKSSMHKRRIVYDDGQMRSYDSDAFSTDTMMQATTSPANGGRSGTASLRSSFNSNFLPTTLNGEAMETMQTNYGNPGRRHEARGENDTALSNAISPSSSGGGAWAGHPGIEEASDNQRREPILRRTRQQPSIISLASSHGGSEGGHAPASRITSSQDLSTYLQSRSELLAGADTPQLQLDEDDIQVVVQEPTLTTDLDLHHLRHKLAVQMVEARRALASSSNRPLSRRTSGSMLADDGQATQPDRLDLTVEQRWALLSEKEQKKRREAVEQRQRDLTIEVLGKAEMGYAHIDIWTESRNGKWIVRGPAPDDAIPADGLPHILDPWAIPIDAKGIVRRKKLKSNVELSSTRTVVVCPDCQEASQLNIAHNCATCQGSERVEMVYQIQCVIRMAQFLPLTLPAALLMGQRQPHIRYIDSLDPDHRTDLLHDRALEGLQSSAARVVRVHHAQHGSRLLMGRVTISRIGLLSVSVRYGGKGKAPRYFDVEDGPDGRITEVTDQVQGDMVEGGNGLPLATPSSPGPSPRTARRSQSASSLFYSLRGGSLSNPRNHSRRSNGRTHTTSPQAINGSTPNLVTTWPGTDGTTMALFGTPEPMPALPSDLTRLTSSASRRSMATSTAAAAAATNTDLASGKRSLKTLFRA